MMHKHMFWGLAGGLVLLVLAGVIVTQQTEQTPAPETASAVAESTTAQPEPPDPTTYGFDEIDTYRNEEFEFTVHYPKTVPWRCQYRRSDDDTCEIDMAPRDLSSIAVRDSTVLYVQAKELDFSVAVEKKTSNFTSLIDLVQYRNEHINNPQIPDAVTIIHKVHQFTWRGYSAIATDKESRGRARCMLNVEKGDYLYMILFFYSCRLLPIDSTMSKSDEYDFAEEMEQKIQAVKMVLDHFVFDKGEH